MYEYIYIYIYIYSNTCKYAKKTKDVIGVGTQNRVGARKIFL